MKKNYFKLTLLLLIVLTIFVIIKPNKKQEVNVINEAKEQKSFAIYKDDGSGNYAISSEASFPTTGYLLNTQMTKCYDSNNGVLPSSIVSQSLDGKITLSATVATYCDLYFTKDSTIPTVTSFSITGLDSGNNVLNNGYSYSSNVTYKIGWSDTDVTHYCLTTNATSCDKTWIETGGVQSINVSNNTFTGTEGSHTIYVYLKDKAQNVSSTTTTSTKTIIVDRTAPGVPTFSIMGKTTSNTNLNGDYSQVVGVGVTLTLGSDIKDYCITTSATCSSTEWKSATTTPSITLPNSEGTKTYNAFVRDNANNVSGNATDSIFLDLYNPSVSNVTYKSKDTSSITVNVTGSDGNGSGIVKYECKATSKSTWFTQDSSGNCKVTGLSEGTQYTIEGRVTDASGRVSAQNRTNVATQTTQAYVCTDGSRVYDISKGSSSGGYVCTVKASDKGWYDTTYYYTCSATGTTHYNSTAEANVACTNSGTCSEYESWVCHLDEEVFTDLDEAMYHCLHDRDNEKFRTEDRGNGWFSCYYGDVNLLNYGPVSGGPWTAESALNDCRGRNFVESFEKGYQCDITGRVYKGSSSYGRCESGCAVSNGVVSKHELSKTNYRCDASSGWLDYSGSGSTLQCYKDASVN